MTDERTSAREVEIRERCQHLVLAADQAIADLAQAQSWLAKPHSDDLMAYRAIQRACERLRRGMDVATGHAP